MGSFLSPIRRSFVRLLSVGQRMNRIDRSSNRIEGGTYVVACECAFIPGFAIFVGTFLFAVES
jgi:hypothetical protein